MKTEVPTLTDDLVFVTEMNALAPRWHQAYRRILRAVNAHEALLEAATKWPRCCDLWQDGLGGMHCTECGQKTFAMLHAIQKILGIGKDGKAVSLAEGAQS